MIQSVQTSDRIMAMLRSRRSGVTLIGARIEAAGLRPTGRGEEISLEGFCALARGLAAG
jgi:16S rRNA (adenine1518-N6/adenine1519-N6)-dimethyltransferase